MHGFHVRATQEPRGVHHDIDPAKARQPVRNRKIAREIAGYHFNGWKSAGKVLAPANGTNRLMAGRNELGDDMAANEAGCSQHKNAHARNVKGIDDDSQTYDDDGAQNEGSK